jgi:AcrR family transcriptional regulator
LRRVVQHRLLDIAVREFSLKGLEGASTREIAAAAGTVMSSITYHYGGKEGLYLAAADYVAEQMGRGMVHDPADALDPAEQTPSEARLALHDLIDRFVDKMIDEQTANWSLFIVREQMNPTEAFDRIWRGMMCHMMEHLVALLCAATRRRDDKAIRVAAITLLGQVIGLRSSRASFLKLLGATDFHDDDVAAIKTRTSSNIDALLDALTAERQDPQ